MDESLTMKNKFLIPLVALGLSISSVGFSQETTATQTQTTTDAQPKVKTTEDQAFPVAKKQKRKIGSEYIRDTHGDWKTVCVYLGKDKTPNCRIFQILKDDKGGNVAEISILALKKATQAAAGVNFVTPLGTLLSAQAGMRIDAGSVKHYPYGWCEKQGCITRFGLTKEELANLKKGKKAVMTIVAVGAPNKPLVLNVSLKGFTAAWNALKAGPAKKAN